MSPRPNRFALVNLSRLAGGFAHPKLALRSALAAAFFAACTLANCPLVAAQQPATETSNKIKVEVFIRPDSPRCEKALEYFDDLANQRSGLDVVVHDVIKDQVQLKRLWDLAKKAGYEKPAVPMVFCCRKIHIGFDDSATTGPKIEDLFTMHVYTRWTCPRCNNAKAFLRQMQTRWPGLNIVIYEVTADVAARDRWNSLSQQFRIAPGLPTIHFSGQLIVGYQGDAITGKQIESLVREASGQQQSHLDQQSRVGTLFRVPIGMSVVALQIAGIQDDTGGNSDSIDDLPLPEETGDLPLPDAADSVPIPDDVVVTDTPVDAGEQDPPAKSDIINVPVFGELRVSSLGLPAFTFLVGLVDGFNPCAMWVLVFLLSVLVNIKDRRKMIAIAGTFVVVSGVAYFAFMAAWLNVLQLIGLQRPVQIVLGCMAVFIGLVNVKDFFAFKKGLSLSIPESQKPGIYARVRDIVNAKYLTAAISAAVALAIVVNIVELLCTAGLPALYSQILMMQELPNWANYCYLGLYNLAYMLDDSILLGIVVVTLSRRRLQEREGRWLKLVSGVVILALGATMIFRPNWLQLST